MKNFYRSLMSNWHCKHALHTLQGLEKRLATPHTRLAVPYLFKGKGFFKSMACMQNPFEIEALYHLVRDIKPSRVLEIGTAKGGALYLWLQAAADNATVISVDLPDGEFGGGYKACRIPLYQAFARKNQKLHLVRADSHKPETLSRVRALLSDAPLDFLFIDGDHTYEGVKQDFDLYAPLVRPGGIVAFHDILPRPDIPDIQVDRFWKEIRARYPDNAFEIIGPEGSGRTIGSGVIIIPSGKPVLNRR